MKKKKIYHVQNFSSVQIDTTQIFKTCVAISLRGEIIKVNLPSKNIQRDFFNSPLFVLFLKQLADLQTNEFHADFTSSLQAC